MFTVSSKNISKSTKEESEDCIIVDTMFPHHTLIIQADGNGSMGYRALKIQKEEDGKIYSTVALGTAELCKHVHQYLTPFLKHSVGGRGIIINTRIIRCILLNSMRKAQYQVYCCIMITIVDKRTHTLHTFSIGDCSYAIYDVGANKITEKTKDPVESISKINKYYMAVPSSVIKDPIHIPNIHYYEETLPQKYCLIVSSDGLVGEVFIPENLINNEKDPVEAFNTLRKDPKFALCNMTDDTLRDICKYVYERGAEAIADEIVKTIYPLQKVDDVSFCVLCTS